MSVRSKRNKELIVLAVSLVVALVTTARADIIHVPGDFPTIQEAIDAAMDGDEVEVHPGTYNENIDFLGKAITVYSTDGPEVTIIDAQQTMGTVVTCKSREGPDTILDGFTVTGGLSPGPGGMQNFESSPTVTNCTFSGNYSALFFGGGGMSNRFNSSPTVTNCTFSGNGAGLRGGGMANDGSSPTVTGCTFYGNIAEGNGGGMFNYNSSPTVTNCTFSGNTADDGGGMANEGSSSPTVTNCTFSGNGADNGGGGMLNFESSPTVTNSILWGNSPDEIFNDSSTLTVTFSNVQGGIAGTGNIDADPLFVSAENGNLRLSPDSPCIDAADNTAVPKGIDTDLDGNLRFVDDPDTKDTGNGDPPIVDMGAYEFHNTTCPWDMHGDGFVGPGDVLILFGWWGFDPGGPPDFDGDGTVGLSDLLILLANWGLCP